MFQLRGPVNLSLLVFTDAIGGLNVKHDHEQFYVEEAEEWVPYRFDR